MLIPSSGSMTFFRASRTASSVDSAWTGASEGVFAASWISARSSAISCIPGDILSAPGLGHPGEEPEMPMRILIVDDHPVTRDGLRSALSITDEVEIVGEAASGEEAIDFVDKLKPEVVFMDVRMPGMGGMEASRIIKQGNPDTRVILFTVDDS